MEREILFRGKTATIVGSPYNNGKSDGEWVYGYLFTDLGATKIRQYSAEEPDCTDYEVDSETVGQYTGLTDDNGVKIFEGDIVKIEGGDWRIGYSNALAKFLAFNSWGIRRNIPIYSEREVIGNIHDNPELLEG